MILRNDVFLLTLAVEADISVSCVERVEGVYDVSSSRFGFDEDERPIRRRLIGEEPNIFHRDCELFFDGVL